MGKQAIGGSGGIQGNKRWSLIHGSRLLAVLLVISMIHVAASHNKKTTHDQGSNIIRTPRNAKTTLDSKMSSFGQKMRSRRYAKAPGKTNSQSNRVCNDKVCTDAAHEIRTAMNLSVTPCDDFYEFACGRWHIQNPLPPGYEYHYMFTQAELKTEKFKRSKLKIGNLKIKGMSTEIEQLPSLLYSSCMNVKAIDNLGATPLKERIAELGGWSLSGNWDEGKWDFNKALLSIHKIRSGGPLFSVDIVPGKNIQKNFYVLQAGVRLEKDRYENQSENIKTMQAYRKQIIDVVELLGGKDNTTAEKADEIISFEAQLANVSFTHAEWQQYINVYKTLEQLQQEVPQINWSDYLNKLFAPHAIPKSESICLPTLPYLKKAMKIIEKTPKRVLANYMVWNVISGELSWLSTPFRKVEFEFRKVRYEVKTEKKRGKICTDSVFASFGDIITAAYISENEAELKKRRQLANEIVNRGVQAFKENVKSVTWLDNVTRTGVFEKLDGVDFRVGFADYMLNANKTAELLERFNGLNIKNETFYKNKLNMEKKARDKTLKELRKPRDNTLWDVSPLAARPQYNFLQNRLSLPAVILQPPILYPNKFLRAYSLGKFGFVYGHEIMHGFGKDGRGLDKDGKGSNWFSNDSLLEFNKKLKCYENQYSLYKIFGKHSVRPKKKAEENIADNDALKIAAKAYYDWAKQNPSETWRLKGLDEFSNEQLFYIGYAQSLCSTSTLKDRLDFNRLSGHTDDKFRVIGPFSNSCEFAKAFSCKINSPMNPVEKCYLWSKEGSVV